jgi:DNA invertase Pin-like site-specific DNA recombinase
MNAKAYSYARWSSRRQADGQSLERQLSAAKAYADFHKLDLDPSMVDDGVSAYRGKNRLRGELASFKARIVAGEIPVGSYFLIDSYDRFSREEPTISVQSLLEIINAGVNVVTLSNNMVFKRGTDSIQHLLFAVMDLDRAHKESLEKGRKIKLAHDASKRRAREEGRAWTPVAPSWFQVTMTGIKREKIIKHEPIEERVKVIREIFDLYENGVSTTAIARMFNDRGVLTNYQFWQQHNPKRLNGEPRKRVDKGQWSADTVLGVLQNRAVLGEQQPHTDDPTAKRGRRPDGPPIIGLYPAILEEEQFNRVQARLAARKGAPRQNSATSFNNLFSGLGRRAMCGECGGLFSLHSNANYDNRTRIPRLRCVSAQQGGKCDNRLRLKYPPFEAAFLRHVVDFEIPAVKAPANDAQDALDAAILKRDALDVRADRAMRHWLKDETDHRLKKYYDELRAEFAEAELLVDTLRKTTVQASAVKTPSEHKDAIASFIGRLSCQIIGWMKFMSATGSYAGESGSAAARSKASTSTKRQLPPLLIFFAATVRSSKP